MPSTERIWKPFGVPSRLSAAGHAAMIVGPAPPRARERRQHVMMVRRRALPAVGGVEIMMLGRVGVAGEADGIAPPFEQLEERLPVLTRF